MNYNSSQEENREESSSRFKPRSSGTPYRARSPDANRNRLPARRPAYSTFGVASEEKAPYAPRSYSNASPRTSSFGNRSGFKSNSRPSFGKSNFKKPGEPRKVMLLHELAQLPIRISNKNSSAVLTLVSKVVIPAKSFVAVPLGIAIDLKPYEFLRIVPAKELVKDGLFVLDHMIDAQHTGELTAYVGNYSDTTLEFSAGQQILEVLFHATPSTGLDRDAAEYIAVNDFSFTRPQRNNSY